MPRAPLSPSRSPLRPPAIRTTTIAFAAAGVVVAGLGWYAFRGGATAPHDAGLRLSARRIAATADRELYPAISPDGQWMVYAMQGAGEPPAGMPPGDPAATRPFDLFLQSIDGQNPINLTQTPDSTEWAPAYSPDGASIAFRRSGAPEVEGIWVMGRTGEQPRRVSPRGFHPAWSPDGKRIYFSSNSLASPRGVFPSDLWVIDIASEQASALLEGGTAYQPSPSPSGHRVAYWALPMTGGSHRAT